MRLLICDDHSFMVDALSLALTAKGHVVVATALNPDEAVEAAREHQPDVALLDLHFPQGGGISAIGGIHDVSIGTKVVIVSGSASGVVVADAIAQGADGFVGKAEPIEALIAALQMAQRGRLAVDPAVLEDAQRSRPHHDDPLWGLRFFTPREWQALRYIVDGLTTQQIARHLGVQISTARTHVGNVRNKLGATSRLQVAALMGAHATDENWPVHLRVRTALHEGAGQPDRSQSLGTIGGSWR